MTATELYRAGKLSEAIQAIGAELRDHPTDVRRRTFLFELLCFAGDFGRAEKHLNVLAEGGPDAATGVLVYRAALHAEKMRTDLFSRKEYPGRGGRSAGERNLERASLSNPSKTPTRASVRVSKSSPPANACGCRWRI